MRVLLIDDEPLIVEVLTEFLSDEGHQVTASADGRDTLFQGLDRFDLVITDLVMPNWSDLELPRTLRAIAPDLPFVVMSGGARESGTDPLSRAVNEFGVQGLRKPFTLDQLAAAIAAACRG